MEGCCARRGRKEEKSELGIVRTNCNRKYQEKKKEMQDFGRIKGQEQRTKHMNPRRRNLTREKKKRRESRKPDSGRKHKGNKGGPTKNARGGRSERYKGQKKTLEAGGGNQGGV